MKEAPNMANRHPYPEILADGPEPALDLRALDAGVDPARVDPDHHLWRNGRFWWVALTTLHEGWRQERVRCSLQTEDVCEARRRRDRLIALLAEAERCGVSLRFRAARRGADQERSAA
jgi:hypothetical protein